MQRRKFVTGLGALATGSAAALGTGAFNFANVERGVSVNVADDSNAFLALTATSDYADGSGNKLTLTFNGDAGPTATGNGINEDSDYSFTDVFSIRNQGSQSVGVWIEDNDNNDAAQWYTDHFGTSIEGNQNAYALDPGESVEVDVVLLTRNNAAGDLPNTINVKADASAGN